MKNLSARIVLKTIWVLCLVFIITNWFLSHMENLQSEVLGIILVSIGSLFGLIATFMILTQFILISGARWMDTVWGLDRLAASHRRNGKLLFYFVLAHFSLIVTGYNLMAQEGLLNWVGTYFNLTTSAIYLTLASIAWYLIVTIVFTSIVMVRRRLPYELWHTIHFLTYLAASLPLLHQLELGKTINGSDWFAWFWVGLYIFCFATLLYFKWIRPVWIYLRHRFVVDEVITEANSVVSVYITGRQLDEFRYIAGQFAFWWFLSKELWYQPHPFTISSSPGDKRLRITVKDIGSGSAAIQRVQPGTTLLIDGPYGRFTEVVRQHKKRLFIAGGIGITPLASQLRSSSTRNDTLIYAARTGRDLALRKELLQTKATAIYVLSDEKRKGTEHGRVDENLLKKHVKNIEQHDVWLCGPAPMMDGVESVLLKLGVPASQIHTERFRL